MEIVSFTLTGTQIMKKIFESQGFDLKSVGSRVLGYIVPSNGPAALLTF